MFNHNAPEFAPGEAEEIVKGIRREYRLAAEKQEAGETSRAAQAKRRAENALVAMQKRLEHVLDRQVSRRISFASPTDRENALADLQLLVLRAIMDTSGSRGSLFWEERFNMCVVRRTIDVLRTVQTRYFGKSADGNAPTGAREITFSALEKNSGDGVSGLGGGDRFIDRNAEREIEAVLETDLLERLIAELGEKQRGYLSLWWRNASGETWDEIAASENLKTDTARKRGDAVIAALNKVATA